MKLSEKEKVEIIVNGYADAIERTIGKRAPDCTGYQIMTDEGLIDVDPDVVLGLCREQAPEEVTLYWDGVYAGFWEITRVRECKGGDQ